MRLIDADALKALLIKTLESIKRDPQMTRQEMHIIAACDTLSEMIDDTPTVEPEVKRGGWIEESNDYGYPAIRCSYCGAEWECTDWALSVDEWRELISRLEHCPTCGADMRTEE